MASASSEVTLTAFDLAERQKSLRKELAAVTLELQNAKQAMAAIHNDTLPATSGLPAEIMTQIFTALHESQSLVRNSGSDKRLKVLSESNPEVQVMPPIICCTWPRGEVVVSQVCSHWRQLALGLPSLWSLFWTRPERTTCEGIMTETKRLREYLRRSKGLGLELYLEFQPPAHLPTDSDTRYWKLIEEMVATIMPYAYRWKCFTFSAVNHDRRMSDILLPTQKRLARASAPKLEKFVVRTSPSVHTRCRIAEGTGWTAQVLLPDAQFNTLLRHLRLDRAGLTFCRPSLQGIAHLVLEYGARADDIAVPTFEMDWIVFINEILRSPHLESLSLCDNLLRTTTFPGSPWSWNLYHVKMEKIKHLRLGRQFNRSERHCALYFLLRYITAPLLESLTIAGYAMEESPWGLAEDADWLEGWDTIVGIQPWDVFPSLKSLYIIDVTLTLKSSPSSQAAGVAFVRLALITSSVTNLVVDASLKPLFDGRDCYGWMTIREFWPQLQDVTFNFVAELPWQSTYSTWIAFGSWRKIRVLRIPASEIPSWFHRTAVVRRVRGGCGMKGEEDTVMSKGSLLLEGYDYELLCYGLILKPIEEVLPMYWPPDSNITVRNTLEFEAPALPFHSDRADAERS